MNSLLSRIACATVVAMALAWSAQAQTIGCTTGGPGGSFPTSGTGGGGTYPNVMPPYDLALPLAVTSIPPGSTCVTAVKLYGLYHTYSADVQIVLQAPGGAKYNLWAQPGSYCDYAGDYTVIPAAGATFPTCTGAPNPPGGYDQYYGGWPSGTNGISNTDLSLIAPAVGTWTLRFYDWYGGDVGSLSSWDLCFGTPPPPPPPTAAPVLVSPTNGSTVYGSPVNLSWNAVPIATTYDVDVDGTITNNVPSTALAVPLGSGAHTWTVRGVNASGAGPWAAAFAFTVDLLPPAPVLVSPATGTNVFGLPVDLTWNSAQSATTYDVDFDGAVTTGVTTTNFSVNPGVGLHTWTVRGVNAAGPGPWAVPFTFTIPGPPPASQCATPIGGGGPIPTSGTGGGGVYPTTLPPYPLDVPLAVTAPGGAAQIVDIKLNGFSHTFAYDLQITLEDPAGAQHNLACRPGLGNDFLGDYTIYETYGYTFPTTTTPIPTGAYAQWFGTWNSGDNNIFNTPLGSIPVASGTYTLHIYDWAGIDVGALTSWEICFDTPSGPVTYCTPTAPGTSSGCIPSISATGNPDVAHSNSCVITVADVEGAQSGIIFYGVHGTVNLPWCSVGGSSFLCVKAPLWRTPVQNAGGTYGTCTGLLTLDWNAYQLANPTADGNPWSAGDQAHIQGWFRDPPACKTTFLSEALEFTYLP